MERAIWLQETSFSRREPSALYHYSLHRLMLFYREGRLAPATGAVAALIAAATGVKPYFVSKPNPLMMRAALRRLGADSDNSVMIGDRMDTDIVAGTEAGMRTILVLSGVTRRDAVARFSYQPTLIVESVADLAQDDATESP